MTSLRFPICTSFALHIDLVKETEGNAKNYSRQNNSNIATLKQRKSFNDNKYSLPSNKIIYYTDEIQFINFKTIDLNFYIIRNNYNFYTNIFLKCFGFYL